MLNLEGWLQVLTVKGSNYFDMTLKKIELVDKMYRHKKTSCFKRFLEEYDC
jgi:hypothetical protein